MLSVKNLTLAYEPGKEVLKNITYSFTVPGVYALMGSSGLGKTTLLKALAGRLKPISGTIEGMGESRKAMLFQENRLLPWCSAALNVRLAMETDDSVKAGQLLRSLEIDDVDALPGTFSGGMQRRVALARALAYGSDYLFLDEPFTGMDNNLKAQVAPLLKKHGVFILFSTHDASEAMLMGAEKLLLYPGRLEKI